MRKLLGVAVLVIGVGVLGWYGKANNAERMQATVTERALTAATETVHPISTKVSGRDITVTGIADGEADINQCPPGGDVTIAGLAELLNVEVKALDTSYGEHKPKQVAIIDESVCIGCVMCIKACPTDAIVGAAKLMHTVIERDCTGCELCIEPCPVDCIDMIDQTQTPQSDWRWPDYSPEATQRAREQTNFKLEREQQRQHAKSSMSKLRELRKEKGTEQIKSDIAAALARVKRKRES